MYEKEQFLDYNLVSKIIMNEFTSIYNTVIITFEIREKK